MDVAVAGDSQQFEESALAAAKEKANLVRKSIGDEKADEPIGSCSLGGSRFSLAKLQAGSRFV